MNKLIGFLILIFLSGCASHQTLEAFKKDDLFEKAVLVTQKSDIINSLETKAIINATYLNTIDKSFSSDKVERFIIGIYITDDEKNEEFKFLNNPHYKLLMNDKAPLSIKPFSKEHKMYGKIPLHNNWAKYYEVEFEKTPKIYKLELKLSNAHFDDAKIVFESE